jgi:endonuclease/exonuclease/phosphatase family metal-dependent hydrolase
VEFRVLSYNIHKGIGGVDRRYRPGRILETIEHYAPDVVFLQEVDDGVPRSRKHRQVDWLAERLGLAHRAFQPNVRLREGSYGNAILSRLPLEQVEDIDLTVPLKKRRRALVARTHLRHGHHSRSLVLANVHLGLAGFERVLQLRRLLRDHAVDSLHKNTPAIVGGDFNDVWGSLGGQVMRPYGFASALGMVKTFPAAYPLRPLDRVFYRGDLVSNAGFAGHIQLARAASDHLPVIVDFRVPGL